MDKSIEKGVVSIPLLNILKGIDTCRHLCSKAKVRLEGRARLSLPLLNHPMQKNTSERQATQKAGRRRQCCLRRTSRISTRATGRCSNSRRTRRRWRRRRRSQARHGARDVAGDVGIDPDRTWARGSARVLGVYGQDGTERRRQVGHNVDGGGEPRAAALSLSLERDVGGFTLPAVEPTPASSFFVGFPVPARLSFSVTKR
ncbi:hypothetical protein B0T26DRAFT_721693 [Lasiosphaeria miniovina]|uniref:Uncharacterized protein n=1 Tax=Lasiosphaeria miniovina TaxID=1954250 RepID=A0AA40A577_9PEZI|nr:uncharacterized protein B0T26DRAFT_721693 [Lasiosphaeria miniovina]KAK0709480.1 hypothetical protein B0T26DRAFT_721693 [Lasiosphaeria miniovina]